MKTNWFSLDEKEIVVDEDSQYVALFIGSKGDKIDSDVKFIHKKPNITSNILIKAILFDNAKFDITGNLVIETGAKHTDSYLKIDVLLMSERASARAIPSLEITEDDVKGGHGASIGPVDPEQLFYLQSKGLNRELAEVTLAEGFIQDAINKFDGELPADMEKEVKKFKS